MLNKLWKKLLEPRICQTNAVCQAAGKEVIENEVPRLRALRVVPLLRQETGVPIDSINDAA